METLSLYLITFNCARNLVQPEVFSQYIFPSQNASPSLPDIIVLNLQEIAPIGYAFLGGSFVSPYFKAFRQAIKLAVKDTVYVNTIARNVGLTGIMVFVRQDLAPKIASTQVAGVGVGIQELGNKGAVGVRIGLRAGGDDSDEVINLTFVSAHLAPFEEAVERRNQDFKNIVRRLIFTNEESPKSIHLDEDAEDVPLLQGTPSSSSIPSSTSGETQIYHPTSHLFFAGDLNYRTSRHAPTLSDYKVSFPQPRSSPSDPFHFSHLLPWDQLTAERRAKRTLHGLTEAAITFPPTYKYSNSSSGMHSAAAVVTDDSLETYPWSPHRWPSWCDRILYLDLPAWMSSFSSPSSTTAIQKDKDKDKDNPPPTKVQVNVNVNSYTSLPLFSTSDHRPVALSLSIPFIPIPIPIPDPLRHRPSSPSPSDTNEVEVESDDDDVRLHPPYPIDPLWRQRRRSARRKEIVVGVLAYLVLTWEGRAVLVGTVIGGVGGWLVLRSLL